MLVEDEPDVARVLKDILPEAFGCICLCPKSPIFIFLLRLAPPPWTCILMDLDAMGMMQRNLIEACLQQNNNRIPSHSAGHGSVGKTARAWRSSGLHVQ